MQDINKLATFLSKTAVFTGDLITKGSIRIDGGLKGNVKTEADAYITGNVDGDVEAENITLEGANIQGNVIAHTAISINDSSCVFGSIDAGSVNIDGSAIGDINCNGFVHVGPTAIIKGNVVNVECEVSRGAIIVGSLVHAHDDIDVDDYFNEKREAFTLMPTDSDPGEARQPEPAYAPQFQNAESQEEEGPKPSFDAAVVKIDDAQARPRRRESQA